MTIVSLQQSHLPALYEIYRRATAGAAHCALVPSYERFAEALTAPAQPFAALLVAEEASGISGIAALLPPALAQDGTTEISLSALFVADEAAGQQLLSACLRVAHERGVQRVRAFPNSHRRCPVPGYNAGWDGLSDALRPVARLLARNGFTPCYRELHMTCAFARFPPTVAVPPAGVSVERRAPDEWGYKLVPLLNGQSAGVCSYSTLKDSVDDPAAAHVGYIWGIGVAEWARRRGIARHLMNLALAHLHELGCTACWLTTGSANWSAQPLYLALGFEVVDTSTSFERDLPRS